MYIFYYLRLYFIKTSYFHLKFNSKNRLLYRYTKQHVYKFSKEIFFFLTKKHLKKSNKKVKFVMKSH